MSRKNSLRMYTASRSRKDSLFTNIFLRPFGRWITSNSATQSFHNELDPKQESQILICYKTDSDRIKHNKTYWRVHHRDALIQGYVRCNESDVELPFCVLYMLMMHIFDHDIWIKYGKHIGDHLCSSLSSFGECIERISDNDEHCYYSFGNNIVSKKNNPVQEWILQLNTINYKYKKCSMIIGIAEDKKINHIKYLLGDFTYGIYNGYALRIGAKSEFAHKHTTNRIYLEKDSLRKGDILKIKLDLRSVCGSLKYCFEDRFGEKIQYGMNENYQWAGRKKYVAFNTIDRNKKYRLVVGMYCKNKLTFLSKMH